MTSSMIQGSASHDPPEVIALIAEATPLIAPIIRQVRTQLAVRVEHEDLVSFGNNGALTAARTYEKKRGAPFACWATLKIRGAILDGLRREAEMPRSFHAKLRALVASNEAEEGLLDEDASSPPSSPSLADERLTSHLTAMATAMAMGTMMLRDETTLESIEDDRGTVEDEAMREQLASRVRAAVAERPTQEREMLERYYFEGMSLEEAAGGMSRSWGSRLLAQATAGVAKSLKRASFEP